MSILSDDLHHLTQKTIATPIIITLERKFYFPIIKKRQRHHKIEIYLFFFHFLLLLSSPLPSYSLKPNITRMKRSSFFHFCFDSLVWGGSILISPARAEASAAFVPSTTSRLMIGESDRADRSFSMRIGSEDGAPSSTTVFRDLKIDVPIPSTTLSVSVPVAAWYPLDEVRKDGEQGQRATYHHRISVRKIASLLIGLDLGFLADKLLSKNYDIFPLSRGVIDGDRGGVGEADVPIQPPRKCPVVILAHGYLGSRFDLYHIAEALASQGAF